MSTGERGPTGDHGQEGPTGERGSLGERGPMGDHGQEGAQGHAGERGLPGDPGPKGQTGERGAAYSSWLTRHVVAAYALMLFGILAAVVFTEFRHNQAIDRIDDRNRLQQREQIETDRAFCALANNTREVGINPNRRALRSLEAAVRQSFELVRPAADASPEQAARTNEFRRQILAILDTVDINGDMPLIDCSAIGNIDFSIQDAIRNPTIPPPPAPGR